MTAAHPSTPGGPKPHPADPATRADPDAGSSTPVMLGIVSVCLVLLSLILGLGHVAMVNHRAAKAADLAALTAADTLRGLREGDPCEAARGIAEANGAELTRCVRIPEHPGVMEVRVQIPLAEILAPLGPAEGRSRAGPPRDSPEGPP